jgi:hypothetical protein
VLLFIWVVPFALNTLKKLLFRREALFLLLHDSEQRRVRLIQSQTGAASVASCRATTSPGLHCRAPNLGSSVHYVWVPGSVVDTYNSNKIDIKTLLLLLMGKYITWFGLHSLGHWPYIVYQRSKTMVLWQRGSIPIGNLECGRNPRLIPLSYSQSS